MCSYFFPSGILRIAWDSDSTSEGSWDWKEGTCGICCGQKMMKKCCVLLKRRRWYVCLNRCQYVLYEVVCVFVCILVCECVGVCWWNSNLKCCVRVCVCLLGSIPSAYASPPFIPVHTCVFCCALFAPVTNSCDWFHCKEAMQHVFIFTIVITATSITQLSIQTSHCVCRWYLEGKSRRSP